VKTVIVACHTLRDEFEKAAESSGCEHPFVWIESGLHLVPNSLRGRIQEELDRLEDVGRVLLGFGFCGHAVAELESRAYELILPRVDDCITLLLGSRENRDRCARDGGVYFLTRGWLTGEFNVWKEYQAVLARYGQERTDRIYERMLAHYRFLGLIDTGAYDLPALLPEVREIASALKLETRVFPGSDEYLKTFFTGPWDQDAFVTIPPNTRIELYHLGLDPSAPPLLQAAS
jgi:hypothetical protein